MATTPETSDQPNIKMRIEYWKNKANKQHPDQDDNLQTKSLIPFAGNLRQPMPRDLEFSLMESIELADWTGRLIREDKRGAISETASPILQRLNISTKHWLEISTKFEERFKGIADSKESIRALCTHFDLTRQVNRSSSEVLYS